MSDGPIETLIRNILFAERIEDRAGGIELDAPARGIYSARLRYRGVTQYGPSIDHVLMSLAASRVHEREIETQERAERNAEVEAKAAAIAAAAGTS